MRFWLCCLILVNLNWISVLRAAEFSVGESAEGILISEAGEKVLFFQRLPKSLDGRYTRANYVHPFYDLAGEVLTEDFPADHRHHRGIFWAWHQLWLGDKKLGDAWTTKDFLAEVKAVDVDRKEPNRCTIKTKVEWTCPDPDDKNRTLSVVEEQAKITVHAREASRRLVDFEIRLRALNPDVKLGGSEDQKGYGGFSTRIKLPEGIQFRDSEGPVEAKTTAVKAGPWLDFSTEKTGLAILDHPANPGYPQAWILRKQRSMQNPAYPGRDPVKLSQETPMVLRYRLVVHDGSLDRKTLDKLQSEWAAGEN